MEVGKLLCVLYPVNQYGYNLYQDQVEVGEEGKTTVLNFYIQLSSMQEKKSHNYWAIKVGLLTPLTFARHRLSPLAAFISGAYFLHNGRR